MIQEIQFLVECRQNDYGKNNNKYIFFICVYDSKHIFICLEIFSVSLELLLLFLNNIKTKCKISYNMTNT